MASITGQLSKDVLQAASVPTLLKAAEFTTVYQGTSKEIVRSSWLLELVVKGSLGLEVGRTGWRDCSEHTGILYAPGTHCGERAVQGIKPNRPTTSLYMEFNLQGVHPFGDIFNHPEKFAWIEDRDGSLEKLLRDLIDAISGGVTSASIYALGTYYQIMSLLIAAEKKGDTLLIHQAGLPMPAIIMNAHCFMRDHLGSMIRLRDIASYVGLSESGFSHAYVRITGRSPLAALRDFRIEAAKNKILQGSLTLAAIAEQTGFSDAFHLSRSFKKVIGMSPRQYLKSLRS